jgi:hypothetical protein
MIMIIPRGGGGGGGGGGVRDGAGIPSEEEELEHTDASEQGQECEPTTPQADVSFAAERVLPWRYD